jgi:hypothetical protein
MACMLLSILSAALVPSTRAVTLNPTDDGMSVPGMFFAKLEAFRLQYTQEKVRSHAPS